MFEPLKFMHFPIRISSAIQNKLPNEAKCRQMTELTRVTIKEAAAEANIGYIAVSGVFHGHETFSADPLILDLFDRSAAHPNQKCYAKIEEMIANYLQAE
ncbi:unnamed protein product [Adineta ricciae]|uniref:Uncharacterized protein n=1 Tax=Adineta ricciae TaxID=249248 RepID=A0A815GHC7_ADIRI|nr:unnamed protein product [Adineta ricciae]CAF1338861.1 unnamed protein product [Adineta ricciae]